MSDLSELLHLVPDVTRHAVEQAARAGIDGLRAPPPRMLSAWAAEHYRLAGESSHQRGGWVAWPFQVGLLDAMGNDDICELVVMKSKRVGYTKCLVASIAYDAAHRRRNQAVYQPTDDDRDSFVKSEIDPMLDLVEVVSACRAASGGEDTIRLKQMRGCSLHLLGGKAARAYRRITVAAVKMDELDGFDWRVEKSADPFTLANGRLEGAPNPKMICGSTPRVKGHSHIERRIAEAVALMRYHVTCAHCGADHPLLWGGKRAKHGLRWEEDRPETAHHVCPHCHGVMSQADYLANWVGSWVCERTGARYGPEQTWTDAAGNPTKPPQRVAMHLWAAYSPQRAWSDIARECIAAARALEAGDDGPMQGFVNETLAEVWEPTGDKVSEHDLQRRAEDYPLCIVPAGALYITAGVDVQGDRCEIGVWGWGRGLESWDIDHIAVEINPSAEEDWLAVEQYLMRRYVMSGQQATLGIDACTIDSNYQTQAVYAFVRRVQTRLRIYAGRGDGAEGLPIKGPGRPQDVAWNGQRWPTGIKQWTIGTDSAKDLLHGQLQISLPGAGYVHLNAARQREWFEQLTAEHRIPVRTTTGIMERWVKRRPRNEVLDCRVYAQHAAIMLGLDRMSDLAWTRRAEALKPPDGGAQPQAAPAEQPAQHMPPPPQTTPPPRARRGGWSRSW